MFTNLLNNAAKYTDPGGAIAVHLDVDDREATVVVEDNGIGIAPEQIQRVFDMFAQVERSNDRVQGGLGIGLNIVKHLVGMHGGRIGVRGAPHPFFFPNQRVCRGGLRGVPSSLPST